MKLLADSITEGYTVGLIETIWPFAFIIIITTLFYVFRSQIRNSMLRKYIPILLLVLMLIFEYSLIWNIIMAPFQAWTITVAHLPLHLCSTSAILVMLFLIFKKDIFFHLLVIQGIVGAFVTFLFPDTASFPYQYDYWRFFLSHSILYLTPVFFIVIEQKKITLETLKIAFISVHVLAVVAVIFNLTNDTHYMYILPDNTQNLFSFLPLLGAFPFLGNWPWVIVVGELLAIPVYLIVYFAISRLQTKID
jgi:hypothetical integral membrane protein (TIGR02206 family)